MKVLAPILLLAALLPTAWAAAPPGEPGTLLRADTLRRQPRSDAPAVTKLPAGAPVGVLETRPGWLRVGSAAGSGWLRMFSVARPPAAAAASSTATAAPNAAEATRGAAPIVARASSHALILGVGEFTEAAIPPLPGVAHDLRSAQALALAMGVPAGQITVVRDAGLSLDGMVRSVQQLVARVQPGDRVFLYYSGHGTRYRDSGRPGSPCVTSLLTHDGAPFTDSMMAEALNLLAEKTDKLFAFVDACFSGGAVAPPRGDGVTAKFFARTGVASQCGAPSNVVTRGLEGSGARRWKQRDNFIYLSAARDTEIAFEEAGAGGFATRAFRDCALREAQDLDGSGNLSVDEIRHCAQQRIDRWLAPSRFYTPHHLTLFGNLDFVPTLAPAAAPSTLPAAPPAVHPERTLRDIYSQRDDRRSVRVTLPPKPLKVGQDRLELSVHSSHPGYLYLLYAGSDGSSFDLLFPNRLDRDNFIPDRRALRLPRAGWTLQARGPAGTNRLLAIVADAPRDFSHIGWRPTGVFSSLASTPGAARDVTFSATTSPRAGSGDCGPDPARPDARARCSDAFGAALVEVQEVP